MDPHEPLCLLPIRACLPPETGSAGSKLNRQVLFFNHRCPVYVCEGNLCCWIQVESILLNQVHILFQFGELSCPKHAFFIGKEWWKNLCITMFFYMKIKHEVYQGPFKFCTLPPVKWEVAPCNPCTCGKIKYTMGIAQGKMVFGFK